MKRFKFVPPLLQFFFRHTLAPLRFSFLLNLRVRASYGCSTSVAVLSPVYGNSCWSWNLQSHIPLLLQLREQMDCVETIPLSYKLSRSSKEQGHEKQIH